MVYKPKYHTCEELLEKVGFVQELDVMGWIKQINKKERFHALTHRGKISMHMDFEKSNKIHEAASFAPSVIKQMKKIKDKDIKPVKLFNIGKLYIYWIKN